MFALEGRSILLRDFQKEDIERRMYWEQEATEWQLWDAPWEYEQMTAEERRADLDAYIRNMHGWAQSALAMSDADVRTHFEICTKAGEYIGWCSSYCIDDECNFTRAEGKRTLGIDIPEVSMRGRGYAFEALCLFIDYLLAHGESELYTQTWSGNARMLGLAGKLGFREYRRKKGVRSVRGVRYDALTFRLDEEKYRTVRAR